MQVEIMMALEEKFTIDIDATGTENIEKVEDVAVLIEKIVCTSSKPCVIAKRCTRDVIQPLLSNMVAAGVSDRARSLTTALTCSFQESCQRHPRKR